MWVPTDVNFVARFPSNPWFFRRNRGISNDHELHSLRVTLLASSVQQRRKRENERKKRAAHSCKVRCRHRKTDVVKLN